MEILTKRQIDFLKFFGESSLSSQFLRATEAKDFPRLIEPIEVREWQDFFIAEAKKLKGEIER